MAWWILVAIAGWSKASAQFFLALPCRESIVQEAENILGKAVVGDGSGIICDHAGNHHRQLSG